MPNIIAAFRVAPLSTKAEALAASNRYEEAFVILEKIYDLWGVDLPSEKLTLEINLLLAIVASYIGQRDLATAAAVVAARQSIGPKSRLSFASKCYAVQFANAIFTGAGGIASEQHKEEFSKYIETKVDTRSVDPNLARRFAYTGFGDSITRRRIFPR